MNNNNNNNACINRVACNVEHCIHHAQGNACNASAIDVSNPNAQQKAETFCSTFAPKSGCC